MLSSSTWIKLNASRSHSCYIQLENNCQYIIGGEGGIVCSVLMIFLRSHIVFFCSSLCFIYSLCFLFLLDETINDSELRFDILDKNC